MASNNDNQGLQIAVIIFALLTIVMSGATFYVFKLSEDAELRFANEQKQRQDADTALRTTLDEVEKLRKWAGFPDLNTVKEVEKLEAQYKKDMELYGGMALGEDLRNYSKLLATNFTTMKAANEERVQEKVELQKLADQVVKMVANKNETLEKHRTETQTAMDQLAMRSATFEEKDKTHTKERGELNTKLNELREEVATLTTQIAKDAQKYLEQITQLQNQRQLQGEKLAELTADEIKVPDGNIQWVSASTRTVWIDLGRADSIRRQTSFGVWGIDENGVARGPKKASIEVTQVLGEHLAEARIIDDEYTNPILIGDKIYTPLWNPGEKLHFAIGGQIDINGDTVSDLPMVRDLINSSGGVLDAELMPDGKIKGAMSVNTRFLIVGEPFSETADKTDPLGKMQKEATQLGVQVIPVQRFLDQVGWKDPDRVVNFGRDSNPADFNYNPPVKGQRAAGSQEEAQQFRKRTAPPSGATRSAYQNGNKK